MANTTLVVLGVKIPWPVHKCHALAVGMGMTKRITF